MRIILVGSQGKMGQAVARVVDKSEDAKLVALVDRRNSDNGNHYSSIEKVTVPADVILDFSHFSGLDSNLDFVRKTGIPLVICTTGYSPEQRKQIEQAAQTLPIFQSPNMSYGIHIMRRLVSLCSEKLNGWDIELTEVHHNEKKDAPSGTAKILLSEISAMRPELKPVNGRTGERTKNEVGVHSLRGGDVVGKHSVIYFGKQESITITHEADSKENFAEGALRACRFMIGRTSKGSLFTMDDLI